jgi:desulfoferrodoxin (superoxide reductase-like protein)
MVSLAEQGKKHQPLVEKLEDKIVIKIGRDIPHPMEEVHLIDSVDILQLTPA